MINEQIRKFVKECANKQIELYEVTDYGCQKVNNFKLYDIYFNHGTISIQYHVLRAIFTFDINNVKNVSYGHGDFAVALLFTLSNGTILLLHPEKEKQ